MDDQETAADFERAAEHAYAAMYDVPPYRAKDCWEDARSSFVRSIDAAGRAGLADEAVRLTARLAHVEKVYNSQFRGVGV